VETTTTLAIATGQPIRPSTDSIYITYVERRLQDESIDRWQSPSVVQARYTEQDTYKEKGNKQKTALGRGRNTSTISRLSTPNAPLDYRESSAEEPRNAYHAIQGAHAQSRLHGKETQKGTSREQHEAKTVLSRSVSRRAMPSSHRGHCTPNNGKDEASKSTYPLGRSRHIHRRNRATPAS